MCMCLWVCVHMRTCAHAPTWMGMHLTTQSWYGVTSSRHLHLIQGTAPPESIAHWIVLWGTPFSYLFTWELRPRIPGLKLAQVLYLMSISPAHVLALSCWIAVEFPYWNVAKKFSATTLQKNILSTHTIPFFTDVEFHIAQSSFWALTNKSKFWKWRTIWQQVLWPKMFTKQI